MNASSTPIKMFLIFGAFVAVLVPKSMAMESASLDKLFCDVLAADIRSHMAERYMRHLSWQDEVQSAKENNLTEDQLLRSELGIQFQSYNNETYNELFKLSEINKNLCKRW